MTEVPEFFAVWCGVSAISACLERKCFVDFRPLLFPNLYIVLVAESALCRKSTAISQATRLLKRLDDPPRMLAQKTTTEALVAQLKTPTVPVVVDSSSGEATGIRTGAQGLIVASELGTLISKQSFQSGLVDLLINLWDSSEDAFVYNSRSHGDETISEPCMSLLGATTMSWIRNSIPEEAIGGGFTSRIIIVHSKRSGKLIARPQVTPELMALENDLVKDLNVIRELEGEYVLTKNAETLFDDIYEQFVLKSPFLADANLSGYAGRRSTILTKVAMCFAASAGNKLVLDVEHYVAADNLLQVAESFMPEVMRMVTSSEIGDIVESVARFISLKKRVTHTQLVRRFSNKLNSAAIDEVIRTLDIGHRINAEYSGTQVSYTIRDK